MSKEELSEKLVAGGILTTQRIIDAFHKIDRANFVPKESRDEAYEDYPLPIGYGQTISQPSTVAFMFELLQPQEGNKILDIGSGSGWTTALLAQIVGPRGRVFGIELVPELVKFGQGNLAKYNFPWAQIEQGEEGRLAPHHTVQGLAPRAELGEDFAGFDRILVSAAGDEMPQELVDQLKIGGRMVIPIRNSVWKVDRISETETGKDPSTSLRVKEFPGFVFVPLK
jgi:protein-L-isoaspartate(D-aspartate) O-methyltransferase